MFFKKTENPNNIIISISASSNKILPTQRIQHVPIHNGEPPRNVEKIIRDIALIPGVVNEIVFSPKEISLIKNKKNKWRPIKKRLRFLLENYIPD
ncbi:MAG: hypothetical protein WCK37_02960 [Candidatus Falkowbacteria bacterium]